MSVIYRFRLLLLAGALFVPCRAGQRVDFRTEVIPVLTKLGCNSGACHGAAAGRGDFHLSLYGSRPDDDYDAIVREFQGRRVNLVHVEDSLILRKPGGELDHEGGYLLDEADEAAQILKTWLSQGAAEELETRQLKKLEADSPTLTFAKVGIEHPLKFVAHFDDGTTNEVTRWTVVTTADDSAVSIDPEANVFTVNRPGRHVLMARYLNQVIPVELIVPFAGTSPLMEWERNINFIDDRINTRLNQLDLSAAAQADDATFLRRISLDLTGRLPDRQEVLSFLQDDSSQKRDHLIRRLLQSDEFVDYWVFRLAQQLRIRTQPGDRIGARTYHTWLRQQLVQQLGWDRTARDLLLSSGDSQLIGEANFYRTTQGAREQTEFVSEALMGVTLRCANCHDHPFDRWTQDDYHGLAAIFAKVKQGRVVEANPLGLNTHPVTGEPAMAQIPGGAIIESAEDGRQAYTDWLVGEDNPFFAKAMVNRIWKALMGRGLVEPVDDLRLSNPATHPQLLAELASDFSANGYRLRHTIEIICRSDAYQRDRIQDAAGYQEVFYGSRLVNRLPPEVLADAICSVTGVPEDYPGEPRGTRAIQLFDSKTNSTALDVLGRCSREESCEAGDGASDVGLSSQLHLMNGELINSKLASKDGRLAQFVEQQAATSDIVTEFYLLAYSRRPSENELAFWLTHISNHGRQKSTDGKRQRLEDFVWSLLNSKEFYCNH